MSKLGGAPRNLVLLRIRVADSLDLFEINRARPKIRETPERAAGEHNLVAVFGLSQSRQTLVQHDQWSKDVFLRFILFARRIKSVKPARLCVSSKRTQDHFLGTVDEPLLRIETKVAKANVVFAAFAQRDANRFRFASWIQLPNVVRVVNQERLVVV